MILGIDIGNTNITFGVFKNDVIDTSFRIMTNSYLTSDEIGVRVKTILTSKGYDIEDIEDIIISSVVPSIMNGVIDGCKYYLNKEPIVLSNDLDYGIGLKTDYPNEIGIDRIVDMVAAKYYYSIPAIVIDFGTANTYDIIDNNSDYIAGLTTPGIRTSLYGLVNKAAKLTNIELSKPKSIMAKNTKDSMNAGIIYGQVGQAKYIIDEFKSATGLDLNIVITGGLGELIKDYFIDVSIYDKDLTLKGLMVIYKRLKNENWKC